MGKTIYLNRIAHRPASRARVLINGIGVYDRTPDKNIGPISPINHWMIPGENAITIELLPAPRSPATPYMGAWFRMQIITAEDQDTVLWQSEYPDDLQALGLPIDMPRVHEGVFVLEKEQPQPVYLKGTPEDFPVEGTAAQRETVRELYDSFATRDAARFEAVMDLKAAEFERFYEPTPRARAEALQMMNAPWIMEDFNEGDLRFDRYAGGRVAHVRRESGRAAVRAVHAEDPAFGWGTNFYMTCLEGRWRIFW